MNPLVDNYLIEGCGRCPLGNTPQCKVHKWTKELETLRAIVLDCGLNEELKWSIPCYTWDGSNIAIVAAFVDYCALSFFKGVLLYDEQNLLTKSGESSQSVRFFRFTNVKEIIEMESILKAYIYEAIEIEKAGVKVKFEKNLEPIPEEFQNKLDEIPELKAAFEELTPGKQRGYIIYFSAPKQSKTRISRIEKYIPQILAGVGFHDHYKSKK